MSEGGKVGKVSHASGDSEGKERTRDKIGAGAAHKKRAAEVAPSISAHGLSLSPPSNQQLACEATISADPSMSAAGRCGHFQLGHFGCE
jgi:hypothetical protein